MKCDSMYNQIKPGVDIAKFFFAVNIVFLHYGIIDMLHYGDLITAMVTRLAVPFFFVSSGYFWAGKLYAAANNQTAGSITVRYCKRLGWKLLIFEPISIGISVADSLIQQETALEILVSVIQGILFYPSGSLWYIQAVIVAVILLTPIIRRGWEQRCIIPALVLYFIGALGNRYFFLVEDTVAEHILLQYDEIFVTTRNGLFFGFPFVLLGALLARFEKQMQGTAQSQTKAITVLFALSYFLCFAEFMLVTPQIGHGDNALYLSYVLVVPLLFVLAMRAGRIRWNTVLLRNLSTSIYLIHRPIGEMTELILEHCFSIDSVPVAAGTGLVATGLSCLIVYRRKSSRLYDWMV